MHNLTWNRGKEASIGLLLSLPVRGMGHDDIVWKNNKKHSNYHDTFCLYKWSRIQGRKSPRILFRNIPRQQEVQSPSLTVVHQWDWVHHRRRWRLRFIWFRFRFHPRFAPRHPSWLVALTIVADDAMRHRKLARRGAMPYNLHHGRLAGGQQSDSRSQICCVSRWQSSRW